MQIGGRQIKKLWNSLSDEEQYAVWATSFVNDLPDSSFAYIEPGGTKDSDGKTTPRSKRHLPYKDASGKPDPAHVRNALARLSQVQGMPDAAKSRVKTMLERLLGSQKSMEDLTQVLVQSFDAMPVTAEQPKPLVRVHAFEYTTYPNHPVYGDVTFTPQDAAEMIENFNNNVTGAEIQWNYEHKQDAAKGAKASGWVRGMEATDEGLFVFVEPTDTAWDEIQKGEWKYSSIERWPVWTHPKDGVTYKNVLTGGAFTNTHYFKGIQSLNFMDFESSTHKEGHVDIAELAKRLGLSENATEQEVNSRLGALTETEQRYTQSQKDTDNKVQAFKDTEPELYAEIVAAREYRRNAEAQQFAESFKAENGAVLAPAHREEVKQAYMDVQSGKITMQEFAVKMADASTKGLVKLGEDGRSTSTAGAQVDKDNQDQREMAQQFAALARKKVQESDGKLDYVDALQQVAIEKPELAQAYADIPIAVMVGGGE